MPRLVIRRFMQCAALMLALSSGPAQAQQETSRDIREERIAFDAGQDLATLSGKLTGYQMIDYLARAQAGQTLVVTMTTTSTAAYFNLLPPGEGETAIHVGSVAGNAFADRAKMTGEYRIRVYQMRSAARRGEVSEFELSVQVTSADFADGLMGGPDFWDVSTRSDAGRLNIRARASVDAAILATVENGTVLRNQGCKIAETIRWCQVQSLTDPGWTGWAAGEFLVESGYVEPR